MATINIGGKERELNLTFGAVWEAEKYPKEFGENFYLVDFLNEFEANPLNPDLVAKLLWLELYQNSTELKPDDVKKMLRECNLNIRELTELITTTARMGIEQEDISEGEKKKIVTKPKSKLPKKK